MIWGGLVPYDQVWRTGADEATTISLDKDVVFGDKKLAAGIYALFTIPGEETWTVIFNKVAKQWGAFRYSDADDALRITATPVAATEPVEEMDFVIEGNKIVLRWEMLTVPIDLKAAQ